MSDLWPTDLIEGIQEQPVSLLIEQAQLLGRHTSNLVTAEVRTVACEPGSFAFDFVLVVPTLDYRFTLFTVEYGIEGFPVVFKPYSKIGETLARESGFSHFYIKADDSRDFEFLLREILACAPTRKILRTLIGQAQLFPQSVPF